MSRRKIINGLKVLWLAGNLSLLFFFGGKEGFVIAILLSSPVGLGMACLAFYVTSLLHLHFWNYALYLWPCLIIAGYWQWFILPKWIYRYYSGGDPALPLKPPSDRSLFFRRPKV